MKHLGLIVLGVVALVLPGFSHADGVACPSSDEAIIRWCSKSAAGTDGCEISFPTDKDRQQDWFLNTSDALGACLASPACVDIICPSSVSNPVCAALLAGDSSAFLSRVSNIAGFDLGSIAGAGGPIPSADKVYELQTKMTTAGCGATSDCKLWVRTLAAIASCNEVPPCLPGFQPGTASNPSGSAGSSAASSAVPAGSLTQICVPATTGTNNTIPVKNCDGWAQGSGYGTPHLNSFNVCSCNAGYDKDLITVTDIKNSPIKDAKGNPTTGQAFACVACNNTDSDKANYCNCGVKLNTNVPFIGRCIVFNESAADPNTTSANSSVAGTTTINQLNAFPVLLSGLMKIGLTVILVGSFLVLVVAGVMIASGDAKGGIGWIERVVIAIATLGAIGAILKLINPNFFT